MRGCAVRQSSYCTASISKRGRPDGVLWKAEHKSRELKNDRSSSLATRRASASKMNFGMRFEKSPRSKGPRCRHSFQPSTAIANTQTFPRQSVYLCSTTIAPKLTRAARPKAPTRKATRCDPGGPSPNARSVVPETGRSPRGRREAGRRSVARAGFLSQANWSPHPGRGNVPWLVGESTQHERDTSNKGRGGAW